MCITNTYIKNKYIVRSLTGSENSLHVLATMTECTLIECFAAAKLSYL